jgi:tetratricopeptide (TPR) repeat protein
MRSYADEQCRAADTSRVRREAANRMLDHYLHTAHAAMLLIDPLADSLPLRTVCPDVRPEHLMTAAQAMTWFSAEHDVLLAVLAEALRLRSDTRAWQLASAMAMFLNRAGHWREWVATQGAALDAARRLGSLPAQARVHRCLGCAFARLNRLQDADTHLLHALRLFTQIGDRAGQAHTHCAMVVLLDQQRRHRDALAHSRQALLLFQAVDHRIGQALALSDLGWSHLQLGEYEQAHSHCQQALELCRDGRDHTITGVVWDCLGLTRYRLRQHAQAVICYQRAIAEFRLAGNRPKEGITLGRLGDAQESAGDRTAALTSWLLALDILGGMNHPEAKRVRAKLSPGTN